MNTMKIIYFVRHGESQANVERVFAGSRYDSPLTERGLEQAKRTAEKVRALPIETIISSPLKRAKQTAECIAEEIGFKGAIQTEPLLRERDFGVATRHPYGSPIEKQIDAGTVEGLETIDELAVRAKQLVDWFKTVPGDHILVVGHGTVEAMVYAAYTGRPHVEFLNNNELQNAEIREYRL